MTCEPIEMVIAGKPVTGIICIRGKRWPKCSICGAKESGVRACDAPVMQSRQRVASHVPHFLPRTVVIGADEDLCPKCAEDTALVAIMVADQLRRLR